MASCPFRYSTTINHHHPHNHAPPPFYSCATTTTNSMAFSFSSSKVSLHHSFPFRRNYRLGRCRATSPPSEPPSKKQAPPSSGVTTTLSRFQDSLQIFFAVLFWMSLFFWSCSWGGGNGGRPNKGSRFKK